MNADLLIVEDEPEFADFLRRGLTYEGYRVRVSASGEAALQQLQHSQPDGVLLDVMLPGLDGMTACCRLREAGYAGPVLMLTARNAVDDRVSGLDAGADDYLIKPFAFDELLARLRAVLRRASPAQVLTFGDLELDLRLHAAQRQDRVIPLSRTEYELLTLFLHHPRQVLKRERLLEEVWGLPIDPSANVLDVYVSRLRRKLGEPPLIHTVYGVGYVLKEGTG